MNTPTQIKPKKKRWKGVENAGKQSRIGKNCKKWKENAKKSYTHTAAKRSYRLENLAKLKEWMTLCDVSERAKERGQ